MKVLGILQNLWVKDPERVKAMMERHGRIPILQKLLFYGGLTGKRLMAGLGDEWCNRITWEEASPEIGGHSGSVFKPDLKHIGGVIASVKPDVILTLGAVAKSGFLEFRQTAECKAVCYHLPHPASRKHSVGGMMTLLKQCRRWLDEENKRRLFTAP